MEGFTMVINLLFGFGLFINALLFIPQAIRLYQLKDSKDLSLLTFIGFCLTQISAIIYGFLHKDYILAYGYIFAFLMCSTVTFFIIYYRFNKINK